MRLIDADALKSRILAERDKIPREVPTAPYEIVRTKPFQHGNSMRGGIRKALKCMEQCPTIDAVPVVRCKNCKHWSRDGNGYGDDESHCTNPDGLDNYAKADDFCSYGEKRCDDAT